MPARKSAAKVQSARADAHAMPDIVIYEEDHLTRALLEEWLGEAGYRVRRGTRCGARPAEPGEAPGDLVIVSVYMPRRGVECVRDIQAAHPGRPLIAISGQFRAGLAASGASARALGVQLAIAKPLTREILLSAVRDIVGPAGGDRGSAA